MNVTPVPASRQPDSRRTSAAMPARGQGRLAGNDGGRVRRMPTRADIARRRLMVRMTKYALPVFALALLSSIALWPEFDRAQEQARIAFRRMAGAVDGATLTDARYRGVDEHGRPYTVTAATATEVSPGHINLVTPQGDITLENGAWIMMRSLKGVFLQRTNQLDMQDNVTLYRDDGMTMHTASAAIDVKAAAAAGSAPVHVEGPVGTLDALGFTLLDRGGAIQFGPGHARLNATNHAPVAVPAVNPDAMPTAAPAPLRLAPIPAPVTTRGPAPVPVTQTRSSR